MIFEIVKDFSAALAAMPTDHPQRRVLRLLEEAIRRDVHFIDRHPTTLFQCLWNTCWWYDSPEAIELLLRDADRALYHSKSAGRNRATHSDSLGAEDKEGNAPTDHPAA